MKTKSKNKDQFTNEGKPVIRFVSEVQLFTRSTPKEPTGIAITDEQARRHWDALDSDWTTGAYQEMARRVMGPEPLIVGAVAIAKSLAP